MEIRHCGLTEVAVLLVRFKLLVVM